MTEREALKLALEALEQIKQETFHPAKVFAHNHAIVAIKKALAQPEQEPVAWADLVNEAQQIVESQFLWKKFIDGTPLANGIAVWMAEFAQQYTTPPQRKPLPPKSPCEMTQAEGKMFKLGWLECEAAHGIKEKNT